MDVLQRRRGLYLLCCDVDGGFFKSSAICCVQKQIEAVGNAVNKRTQILEILVKFLTKLETYISKTLDAGELFDQQFDRVMMTYRTEFIDHDSVLSTSPPQKAPMRELIEAAELDASRTTSDLPEPPRTKATTEQSAMPIIVFDEAHELGEEVIALLKLALDQFDMIGVFLSTCGNLHLLLPTSSSYRASGRAATDPVFRLHTTDIYKKHRLTLGRPLWYQYWNTRCYTKKKYNELVTYALFRLCGNANSCKTASAKLSLFMCRFGGLYPSDYNIASDFVTKHLATYVKIGATETGEVREVVSAIAYPSEPVLAEASAYCTSSLCPPGIACSKVDILKAVKAEIESSAGLVKLNKGDLSELLACALIGYQLDYIREASFRTSESTFTSYDPESGGMSLGVPVTDFICALYSGAKDVDEIQRLEGYIVNCTHFTRLPYATSYSSCVAAIERGAAVITYENSRAIDFFIEAYRPEPLGGITSSLAKAHIHSESTQVAAGHPACTTATQGTHTAISQHADHQQVGRYKNGETVFKTSRGAYVYFVSDNVMRYINKRDVGKIEMDTDSAQDPQASNNISVPNEDAVAAGKKGVKEPESTRVVLDNVHLRFSIKNYAQGISRTQAEEMMDAVDSHCEPVNAVGGGGPEDVSVTVLINVGTGLLEPFVSVCSRRVLRSNACTSNRIHIKVALGLNSGTDGECFKHFPPEVLQVIRDVAKSQNAHKEAEMAMMLGNQFFQDRKACRGEN